MLWYYSLPKSSGISASLHLTLSSFPCPGTFPLPIPFTYQFCFKTLLNKEDVVHIYNGILLSHKKEWNWVICRDVDGSRDCQTEWSKSEREKQISYINACMWNLEKWYRWTGLQGRNRDTDVENKCMDTKGGKWQGGVGVMNWEIGIDIYTLICIKWIANKNLLYKINK